MTTGPFDELRGERDAEELAHVASLLDTADARGPRPEFLAQLRARIAAERPRPSWSERLLAGARAVPLAWAAALVVAIGAASLFAASYPQVTGPVAIAGQRVVLLSTYGFVTFDPTTLEQRERVDVPAPEPWVALAADQRTLVFTFGSGARQMRAYDLQTAQWKNADGVGPRVRQFALSRNGSRAYVRDGDAIRIVDIGARAAIGSIPTPGVEDSPLYLAPDDRRLFQFVPQGGLVVYDVVERRETGRIALELKDPAGLSASARIAFSPDGSRLYAVGSTGSPTGPVRILVLDVDTLALRGQASIDAENAPRLSRAESLAERIDSLWSSLQSVVAAKELGTVTQIALSPDGRTLYAARGSVGNGLLAVDVADPQRIAAIGLLESKRSVFGIQASPDGGRLFVLAAPPGGLGDATLLSLDSRTYALRSSATTRRVSAESAVIILKP